MFPSIINRGVNLGLDTFKEDCCVLIVFVKFITAVPCQG